MELQNILDENLENMKNTWLSQPIMLEIEGKPYEVVNSVLNGLSVEELEQIALSVKMEYLESKDEKIEEKIIDDTMNFILYLIDSRFQDDVYSDPDKYDLLQQVNDIYGIYKVSDIMEKTPDIYDLLHDMIATATYLIDIPAESIERYHKKLVAAYGDYKAKQSGKIRAVMENHMMITGNLRRYSDYDPNMQADEEFNNNAIETLNAQIGYRYAQQYGPKPAEKTA